jgi:hypothetical protein
MTYYIAAFKTRTDTMKYFEILKRAGVKTYIINTPKEAGTSCGVSVKIFREDYDMCKIILRRNKFECFLGFFKVCCQNGRNVVTGESSY